MTSFSLHFAWQLTLLCVCSQVLEYGTCKFWSNRILPCGNKLSFVYVKRSLLILHPLILAMANRLCAIYVAVGLSRLIGKYSHTQSVLQRHAANMDRVLE